MAKMDLSKKFKSGGLADSYADMFSLTDSEQQCSEEVIELPVEHLKPFGFYDNERSMMHKYHPCSEDEIERMAENIQAVGILSPLLVRQRSEHEYEILAGHNRLRAAKKAELKTVPCTIKNVTDDEAVVIMNATNLIQRQTLLPSEFAWGYRQQAEALQRIGKSIDALVTENKQDSRSQIFRYMRLTYLIPDLLTLVDLREMSKNIGVSLSYLNEQTQEKILHMIQAENINLSGTMAEELRRRFENRECTDTELKDMLKERIVTPAPKNIKVSIPSEIFYKHFKNVTQHEAKKMILKILDEYFEKS